MQVKSVFHSKTIWFNSVAVGVALYQHYVAPIGVADADWYALAVAAINIILRFRTAVPVTI